MSGRRLGAALLLSALLPLAADARGQAWGDDSTAVVRPPAGERLEGGEPTPEREELERVEALLGHADLADLAEAGPEEAAADRPAARGGDRPPWRLSWRGGAPGAGAGATAGLEGRQGPARLLLRRREDGSGEVVWGGGLDLRGGGGRLVAGTLGCAHGLGLLAAGGGRGATPAATASLAPPAGGVRLLAAGEAEGALRGVSAGLGGEGWNLTGVTGAPPSPATAATVAPLALARLAVAAACGEGALLVCAGSREAGASLTLAGRRADVWWAGEAAAWRDAAGSGLERAWAAAAGARRRGWLVEAQAAAADAGRGSRLGRPPPCLTGWDGWGWSVRVAAPLGRHTRAQALLAAAREREAVDAGGAATADRRRAEVALEAGWRPGWTAELRWRRTLRARRGWGERSPWLPPARLEAEDRTQAVAGVSGTSGGWRIRLAARWLAVTKAVAGDAPAAALARGLAEARAERPLGAGWSLRLAWAGAWGGPADLASCAAPAPGLAVPRRWGGWAGERSVGCARAGRRWSVAGACCLRRPADPALPVRWELWQSASLGW